MSLFTSLLASSLAIGFGAWFFWYRRITVPCELDLEATHDHFHAHVALEETAVNPGDAVQVQAAPTRIEFGTRRTMRTRAEVRQASRLRRAWIRVVGALQFHELYDVGFE